MIKMLKNWEEEISCCKGIIIVTIGFALFCITSIYYTKPPFDYFSKPNLWFIISIIVMLYGYYSWIKYIWKLK